MIAPPWWAKSRSSRLQGFANRPQGRRGEREHGHKADCIIGIALAALAKAK